MFALLKGTDAEYSVNDKLREIDVANENVNSSVDYTGKVSFFKCSAAYEKMLQFLSTLNTKVKGKTNSQLRGEAPSTAGGDKKKITLFASDSSSAVSSPSSEEKTPSSGLEATPAGIEAIHQLLLEVEKLVDRCPPGDRSQRNQTLAAPPTGAPAALSSTAPPSASSSAVATATSDVNPPDASAPRAAGSAIPLNSRFGSPAFRDFLNLLNENAEQLIEQALKSVPAGSAAEPDVDQQQSEQSVQWEKEGMETLRRFKEESDAKHAAELHAHGHGHAGHGDHGHPHGGHSHGKYKLPPGVVISHGPSGLNNGPSVTANASSTSASSHDHSHDGSEVAASSPVAAVDSSAAGKHKRLVQNLAKYLLHSFGDIRRLDYGTGHELNFFCFLYALSECHLFSADVDLHAQRIVGLIFLKYVNLMRRLQTTYWLEPAGSRGVWGLDDYCFLPFLFGSSQLIGHQYIKPKSVRYPETLDGFAKDYMYLDSIRFIMSVKTCSFAEHSPMLNDITIIKTWDQVNTGLWRMYLAEVLGKFAVVQHFIYSPMLQKFPVKPLEVQVVKQEDPCCSDSIHFPSSIGAKKAGFDAPKL